MVPSRGAFSIAYCSSSNLEIIGISGTSAGAMNAAILADGLRGGGRSEARAALASYWDGVGGLPGYANFEALPFPGSLLSWHLDNNPMFLWMDMLARIWSPYQANPCNYNPLRALLERIDFEGLRRDQDAPRVFVGATNVRSGLRRVFDNSELSLDVLLASACLQSRIRSWRSMVSTIGMADILLRHACGYALANAGAIHRWLQFTSGQLQQTL